jgi:glycosyltransferase involved in cell wall biosynthesis
LIPDFRSFWRTFLHFPDVLIANSKATAESYRSFVRKGQRVEVIYNGIDLEEYSPVVNGNSFRKRYKIGDNKFLIGMIGRISR